MYDTCWSMHLIFLGEMKQYCYKYS